MMETAILILRRLKVENANAIAGFTWGFPAITNFLGFTHNLSRILPVEWGLNLTGCGVICHEHQVHVHQPRGWGDHIFALTRNPLTAKGKTAPFNEEGRMHMTVSLVIPMTGNTGRIEDFEDCLAQIKRLVFGMRLAGGTIIQMGEIAIDEADYINEVRYFRELKRKMLPGFALVQRNELLYDHYRQKLQQDPGSNLLDAWLDFSTIKFQADVPEEGSSEKNSTQWQRVSRPGRGWVVPMTVGYRGISPIYEPGKVARTRDNAVPFRFVESIYSLGEWISPHRLGSLKDLIWRYRAEQDYGLYLCENKNTTSTQ